MSLSLTRTHIAAATGLAIIAAAISPIIVGASSHREAPLISADPQADNTDVYAFVSPDNTDSVTLIASFHPFEEPAGGPNFYKFGDDVLYEIKIDSNGDSLEDISYQFKFQTIVQNQNTFLYNTGPITSLTDPDFNIRQTYSVTRVEGGNSTVLGSDIPVPPVNVGAKSTPNYGTLSDAAIRNLGNNMKVFAGQTDDAFFVELGGLFDLLTIRRIPGNQGGGIDGLAGYNVQSIAIQVPINQVTKNKNKPTEASNGDSVIGVWSTTSRRATRVLNANGTTASTAGDWIQVSRLGAPLVNEVVIPLLKKDVWNASRPQNDTQFANYVTNPELATLLNLLYGIKVPPQGPFGSPTQRDDLIAIFLTGIQNLTKPVTVTPSEQLRLNVAVAPTANPNPLGVVGGDNQGYPNGRRLADDVTDISLRAVAGAVYPLFHPEYQPDPLAGQLGDGVDRNDRDFRNYFPYLALPWDGLSSIPHAQRAQNGHSSSASTSSSSQNSTSSSSSSAGLLTCNGLNATIYVQNGRIVGGPDNGDQFKGKLYGTSGKDVIIGTSGNDKIKGKNGNDTICGRGGDDDIDGDDGDDVIIGEAGNDDIEGDNGKDVLCGAAGNDKLEGNDHDDKLDGGAGNDRLKGRSGYDVCLNGEEMSRCEETGSIPLPECAAYSA